MFADALHGLPPPCTRSQPDQAPAPRVMHSTLSVLVVVGLLLSAELGDGQNIEEYSPTDVASTLVAEVSAGGPVTIVLFLDMQQRAL